ncbi:hypothetical protein P1X14_16365 [Sphingomonas sp. AOB5]|uniref:hypothetical protein n=1 Tax=Sphingomonas sp. AOB5 TaxID=3034017 RepID=UPI0023F8E366|nr:hypothetical protein [Sphingomonas sp. AOB5]MDF7776832.1 hypothetical protein [Sphingomonas sp. AOB5]
MAHDYSLCGWRLLSAIALPELPDWTGDDREPEVQFELGEVPAQLDAVLSTPIVQIDAAGRMLYRIEGVADYLVEDGNRITIAPEMPVDAPDIRLFLLGAGLGLLCHQRGVLPIHASAIEIDGRAVMLAGSSGAGKSTLAAAFVRRGFRMLSDDVAPMQVTNGVTEILPSLNRALLWRDSAERAAWPLDTLEQARAEIAKFSQPLGEAHVTVPLAPAALIHLNRADSSGEIMIQRVRGVEAVAGLRNQVYRWRSLTGLLTKAGALQRVTEMAPLIPHHYSLKRPLHYARLDDTIDMILDAVRAA